MRRLLLVAVALLAATIVLGACESKGGVVTGVLTRIDSSGLDQVRGFQLRTKDGQEVTFEIGQLENGAQFPPGHLAEHLATSQPVRVFYRQEGDRRIVFRLEDAPPSG